MSGSEAEPSSRVKREVKQDALNHEVALAVKEVGGPNFIQASYMKQVCKLVLSSDSEKLDRLQPDVASFDKESWMTALKLAVAFLRRYKMDATISTIKLENPETPKSTGFSRASEVDGEFERLLNRKKTEDM